MATTTKNEELKGQSLLTRSLIAALNIRVPSDTDKRFRSAVMAQTIPQLAGIQPNFLIRIFEATAEADYPDADVVQFREKVETHLAPHLGIQPKAKAR